MKRSFLALAFSLITFSAFAMGDKISEQQLSVKSHCEELTKKHHVSYEYKTGELVKEQLRPSHGDCISSSTLCAGYASQPIGYQLTFKLNQLKTITVDTKATASEYEHADLKKSISKKFAFCATYNPYLLKDGLRKWTIDSLNELTLVGDKNLIKQSDTGGSYDH